MAKNSRLKDLQALGPVEVFHADLDEEGSLDNVIASCDYAFLVAAPVKLKSERRWLGSASSSSPPLQPRASTAMVGCRACEHGTAQLRRHRAVPVSTAA